MLVNTHFKNGNFVTHEFTSVPSFLFYLKFNLAIHHEISKLAFISGEKKELEKAIKCCKFFNVPYFVGYENFIEKTELIQKTCNWEEYENLLKEIEITVSDVIK